VLSDAARRVLAPLAAKVVGLPQGGVASAVVDDASVRDIWGGPIYATLRVDALP